MKFEVINIEFVVDDEDKMSAYDADLLACETIGKVYEVQDEDDLVKEIEFATRWNVKSIEYTLS